MFIEWCRSGGLLTAVWPGADAKAMPGKAQAFTSSMGQAGGGQVVTDALRLRPRRYGADSHDPSLSPR
ncbi:hypothetical protein PXNS11_150365 [Stutzerimonas xanthomarina]|nr:hypothetical protein PXNS11_150365 [Stutzerimonas xanthomarina]